MPVFSRIERFKHKISELSNPYLGRFRKKRLNNDDFTIISNNCWGGVCYEYYCLPKMSPTVGMYFFAEEYIRFLSNIREYLSKELMVVGFEESKYKEELRKRGQTDVLIGKLDDVEIVLLHYHDKSIAKEKWNRRIKRVNWDNLIIKFSYMNLCEERHVQAFEQITSKMISEKKEFQRIRRILFLPQKNGAYSDAYYIEPNEDGQIENDTFYWNRYCDVEEIINQK